jgi:hypothetical protein
VQVDGGIFAFALPDLLWETEVTGTDRLGYPLPTGEEGLPRWVVVCDPHHLWKFIRKRLSDRQSRHMVTLCLLLLGELTLTALSPICGLASMAVRCFRDYGRSPAHPAG